MGIRGGNSLLRHDVRGEWTGKGGIQENSSTGKKTKILDWIGPRAEK